MKWIRSLSLSLGLGLALTGAVSYAQDSLSIPLKTFEKKPKLVVVIVIDQFRADYLTRFKDRFLPAKRPGGSVGGFRYLMSEGAYYPFAEYQTLQDMTCPGHAMILTGALPYQDGISTNDWFDPVLDRPVYCVEDSSQPVIADGRTQFAGLSPKYLTGTTVGDELKNAGYPSQVVSISLKDRAAIMLGGHRADLALWFDPKAFAWETSRYYLPDGKLPEWVKRLNEQVRGMKGKALEWHDSTKPTGLSLGGVGAFSLKTVVGEDSLAYPIGVEWTVDAAEAAMAAFKLGHGPATDLLAISFSSHDYLGHRFGPNAREMEEMTVQEDRLVSRLLNSIRARVAGGLDQVMVVLTADHGISPNQEYLVANKVGAGTIDAAEQRKRINELLNAKFGSLADDAEWVPFVDDLNFYLNRKAILTKNIAIEDVERDVKSALQSVPGVAYVFTREDVMRHRLPPGVFEAQIAKSYNLEHSADVVVIPKPFFIQKHPGGGGASHMTGYAYDRQVPLILAGSRFRPGVYSQKAVISDLAATLSFVLGLITPPSSEGRVLSESLK